MLVLLLLLLARMPSVTLMQLQTSTRERRVRKQLLQQMYMVGRQQQVLQTQGMQVQQQQQQGLAGSSYWRSCKRQQPQLQLTS
jgi:hypothetical protein